ncbi:Retrovirus-related Pol polyprotein from transposon TNT 1-94 [Vitis vinifera]|uniref:Retrovirus-related Pol polyprotein from transposon TNT 1-94 n=2 Tax=Vitis vinifera TaxID=29760 RepID=A0A438IZ75_VITVI|nr:Retrovirus-related Pol polyprotein from transposon TNT 1-94 [Vitis vinifera]
MLHRKVLKFGIQSHLSIRPSLFLAISHSGHQSLFSEPREKRFPVCRIVVRKHSPPATFPANFPVNFLATVFSTPQGAPGGDLQFFPKHRSQKTSHFPATRFLLQARLTPTSHPSYLFLPSEPARASFGVLLPPRALRSVFPASSGYFFSTPIPARALGSVLLPFQSMTKYGMASSQVSSVTSPESGGKSEIPNLDGSDSSPILITGHKLNGHNYLQWSQSVLLFICGKGKDEYLTGEAAMLETTEPGFRKWKIENSMIMSWLINSMNNDIGENFLLFGTAKGIWDAAKETYSSSENTSELFRLNQPYMTFRQGRADTTYRKIVEQKRLFKFFLGLNRELDDVRGRIMGIKPLPSLREAFSEVRHEESRKKVMMGSKEQPAPTLDASALLLGHLIVVVEIVRNGIGLGVIIRWQSTRAANSENTSVPEPSPFNKEQMEMLQKLLSQVGSGSTTGIAFTANRGGMKPWIVDTGASDHMTGDAAILQNYKPRLEIGEDDCSAELCSGLYLLSCGQFSNQVSQASCVQSQSMLESFNSVSNSKVNKDSEIIMLHYRLGHPSFVYLAKLFPKLFINKNPASYHCEICQFAKHTRTVYPQIPYKPSTVFSLVHSDVWGPSRIKNISGTRWFVTFVDDHTRVTWVFLMKEKSEVGHIFQTFNLMVQNQFNSKIQVLKSDNAKEYFTSSLSTYLQNHGIIHISSCVDTPQQNGVAERKNRHLLEVARCLMFSSNVPNYFWGEAILTATYLINRMPSRVLTFQSPRQLFLKQFPHTRAASSDLPLKVFGCTAFVHVYPQNRSKFAPRANKCIF